MVKYYTETDLERIKGAQNYHQLFSVAVEVLRRMMVENPGKPVAMVCGPISTGGKGSRKENLAVFSRAIERIGADGLLVFSQMPFEDDMERIYKSSPELQGTKLMEDFYFHIFRIFIKILCFLPGWENSVGANWEHDQAKKMGIPIIYLADHYIKN